MGGFFLQCYVLTAILIGLQYKMKMIWHRAIAENITERQPFVAYFVQQVQIIFGGKKDWNFIVPTVVHVVNMVGFKMHAV